MPQHDQPSSQRHSDGLRNHRPTSSRLNCWSGQLSVKQPRLGEAVPGAPTSSGESVREQLN
ncbi:hypothetical protein I552_7648 [Mycobacterium xenopi 3993]|nr:hypothetical protein I552_7648 [Mycobacterium xenopi 3993]